MTLAVRRPDDAEIVAAWSTSARLHPVDRALALLAAFVDAPLDALSRLSPGQRDTLLCDARRALFGAPLELVAACPSCGEQNALDLDLRALPRTVTNDDAEEQTFELGGRRFRLPDSRDLAAVANEPDPQRAARALAQRCALDGGELDDATLDALDDALAERDAAAAIELRFACAACGVADERAVRRGDRALRRGHRARRPAAVRRAPARERVRLERARDPHAAGGASRALSRARRLTCAICWASS